MYQHLAILAAFVFVYSLVAARLERTPINGPVVYLAFGVLAGPLVLGLLDLSIGREEIRSIAELTLALVLFHDASTANLTVLRRVRRLPLRLLLVGLPLTILLGFGIGVVLFPGLGLIEVAILATILAPTDAALGKAVVTNPVVPDTIREGLNVESGLNDGICVPILFTFLALASESGAGESTGALALGLVAEEIGIGLVIGLGLAAGAAWALRRASEHGAIVEPWAGFPVAALAFASFGLAQFAGGSGFIACFSGGLAFGALAKPHKQVVLEAAEGLGEAFSLVTWVIFGAVVVGQHPGILGWQAVLYAVLSLTLIRMLPVFLCLVGLRASADDKLFVGWFGPRGLASIVFLVIVMDAKLPGGDTIIGVTVATVVLSILAHGISANPLASALGARAKSEPAAA